jgi:hypothetical protein
MDFLVVPTVRFQRLNGWFAFDHGRRRVLHSKVTGHPSARWVLQPLRDAFPETPTYRYLVLDNDAIFSAEVELKGAIRRPSPEKGLPEPLAGRGGRAFRG